MGFAAWSDSASTVTHNKIEPSRTARVGDRVGLRDLFDSDKRSKDVLREEIRLRDEQLSSLQVRLAALEREQVDQVGSAAATQPSQHASDERAEQLAQELEGLRAESDRQQRTIEALRQEALDLRSATECDGGLRLALESQLEAQGRTVDALRREALELAATCEAERNRSQALLESLEEERRSREEESARRQQEHRKLRDAIAAVKTKREASVSQPNAGMAGPVPSVASQVLTPPPAAATPPRDRAFYAAAHRILMQREARVEAAEKALNALAGRFGLKDGPQALELVARVEELEREAEVQRRLGDTAQLAALSIPGP